MAAGDELTHIGSQKCRPVWIPLSRPLHLEGAGSGAIVVMRHGGQLDERVCQFHRQRDESVSYTHLTLPTSDLV